MDPLLAYMNASDEPSANEAAAALARALRRKQDLGTLGVLSGGGLSAPGQSLLGSARNDEESLMHVGVARTARLDRKSAAEIAGLKNLREISEKGAQQKALASQQVITNSLNERKLAEDVRAHDLAVHRGHAVGPATVGPDGSPVKSLGERRMALKENALQPRANWEPVTPGAPTFRTPASASGFDTAEAAYGALQNHRKHAGEALQQLRAAKTPAEADTALAVVNQQMANIASKLRVAEGLNSSDQSNAAVDTMLSLSHGSVASLKNLANSGRLDAILDSAINSAGVNLDTMGASNNLRRKQTKADAPATENEHKQALEWAAANPKDPMAQKILALQGAH